LCKNARICNIASCIYLCIVIGLYCLVNFTQHLICCVFQLPTFRETFKPKIIKIQWRILELQLKMLESFLWDCLVFQAILFPHTLFYGHFQVPCGNQLLLMATWWKFGAEVLFLWIPLLWRYLFLLHMLTAKRLMWLPYVILVSVSVLD